MTHKTRILIADSEPEWCHFVVDILRKAGYDVHTTANVDGALRDLAQRRPDLVITDASLDALLDAFAMQYQDTRFVVFTTSPSVKGALRAYRHGSLDYVNKTFEQGYLLEIINRSLRKNPVQPHLLFC